MAGLTQICGENIEIVEIVMEEFPKMLFKLIEILERYPSRKNIELLLKLMTSAEIDFSKCFSSGKVLGEAIKKLLRLSVEQS